MNNANTLNKSTLSCQPIAPIGLFAKPGYLLLITVMTIFIVEAMVMIFLRQLPALPDYQETIFDAALLSAFVFPILYVFVFRPLRGHIDVRIQVQAEKDKLIRELKMTLAQVETLEGIIPICASCKNIRDDEGFWHKVEKYIETHSVALFSHGICPDCVKKLYPDLNIYDD